MEGPVGIADDGKGLVRAKDGDHLECHVIDAGGEGAVEDAEHRQGPAPERPGSIPDSNPMHQRQDTQAERDRAH